MKTLSLGFKEGEMNNETHIKPMNETDDIISALQMNNQITCNTFPPLLKVLSEVKNVFELVREFKMSKTNI